MLRVQLLLAVVVCQVHMAVACLKDTDCVNKMTMFDEAHGTGFICVRGGCYRCAAGATDDNCHAWIRRDRDANWKARNTKVRWHARGSCGGVCVVVLVRWLWPQVLVFNGESGTRR